MKFFPTGHHLVAAEAFLLAKIHVNNDAFNHDGRGNRASRVFVAASLALKPKLACQSSSLERSESGFRDSLRAGADRRKKFAIFLMSFSPGVPEPGLSLGGANSVLTA
jgi:hypothetical protein